MKLRVLNAEELNNAIKDNEILIVDMYAEWCGPCKMLSPILEGIALKYNSVKVVKIDVDQTPEVSEKYGVRSVPTVLFFFEGKLIQTLIGFQPKHRFESILDEIV